MDESELFFLDEIENSPRNDENRLVYADWLAERGDLRAKFIQLELELELRDRKKSSGDLIGSLVKMSNQIGMPKWEATLLRGRLAEIILAFRRSPRKTSRKKSRRRN